MSSFEDEKTERKNHQLDIEIPNGLQPGTPIVVHLASGVDLLVICPPKSGPRQGKTISITLPAAWTESQITHEMIAENGLAHHDDKYANLTFPDNNGGCWIRTVRASDLNFQWIRMDSNGLSAKIDVQRRFNLNQSVYVRKLVFRPGPDPRFRLGILSLLHPDEVAIGSKVASKGLRLVIHLYCSYGLATNHMDLRVCVGPALV